MIELRNVSKYFEPQKIPVVEKINLTVNTGELLILLGSSGSGKTTLLRMINRLIEPSSGEILYQGNNIKTYPLIPFRRKFGYVFQQPSLFPHMNVERNITIAMELLGQSKMERVKKAHELLELIKLEPSQFANRYPTELSGGQQQRVGVARALAANPECLLMDEPFSSLDAISRNSLQQEILDLQNKLKKTIIFVTHDIPEAFRLADRIVVMNQGKIEQIGTREEITHDPATEFVRQLIQNKPINL